MKKCSICKNRKPISEFSINKTRMDGHQDSCKACKKIYNTQHYKNTKNKFKESRKTSNKIRYKKCKDFLDAHKMRDGCAHCGWKKHPAGLDLHHIDDNKEFNVAQMQGMKIEKIKKELMKCIVLCACCHRIHHATP